MNCHSLNIEELKKFSEIASKNSWEDAFSIYVDTCDSGTTYYIRNEISKRYTNWAGYLSSKNKTAIVIESGLGANVITLANNHNHVYVIYVNEYCKSLTELRLSYLKISNVSCINENELHTVDPSTLNTIVAFNESNDGYIYNLTCSLLNAFINADLYYVCNSIYAAKHIKSFNRNLNRFHYTGNTRDPFQITPGINKINEIGKFKYLLKKYLPKYFNEYVSLTTLSFNESFYEALCFDIRDKYFDHSLDLHISNMFVSKPNGALLFLSVNRQKMVVRISFDALANKRLDSNTLTLKTIDDYGLNISPKLIARDSYQNIQYSVESMLTGVNIKDSELATNDKSHKVIEQSYKYLVELHEKTANYIDLVDDYYNTSIQYVLDVAKSRFDSSLYSTFDLINNYIHNSLYGKNIALVLSHGDFSVDNIIVNDGSVSGVIDWDYSQINGLPIVDLLFFISSTYKKRRKFSNSDMLMNAITHESFGDEEIKYINQYCHTFNIDKSLIKPLSIMYVMHHIAFRLEQGEPYSYYNFYKNMFSEILKTIKLEIKGNCEFRT